MGIKILLECDKCGDVWDKDENRQKSLTRVEIRFIEGLDAEMYGYSINMQNYEAFYCKKCMAESNFKYIKRNPGIENPTPVQPTANEKITEFLTDLGVQFEQ